MNFLDMTKREKNTESMTEFTVLFLKYCGSTDYMTRSTQGTLIGTEPNK